MKLVHFSASPVVVPYRCDQPEPRPFGKPAGLWLSDEDDDTDSWSAWCESEQYRDTSTQTSHLVTLRPDHRVLVLGTVEALGDFDATYGIRSAHAGIPIDWQRVAEQHQGIIITPYQWECRYSIDWYYIWDCASGCIWDPDAIESIAPQTGRDTYTFTGIENGEWSCSEHPDNTQDDYCCHHPRPPVTARGTVPATWVTYPQTTDATPG